MKLQFEILENEYWWGGAIHDGKKMPFSQQTYYKIDLNSQAVGNQSSSFYLSTKGRYIWSDKAFCIEFNYGTVTAYGNELILVEAGSTLKDAYHNACKNHFEFNGKSPEKLFYTVPQYNTWVELLYDQNQRSVLKYAEAVIDNGFKPGILMIDDTWQENYGVWNFHPVRFPSPKEMILKLHNMGFKVMLWVVPYISPDSPQFREAQLDKTRLIRDEKGKPIMLEWWNGFSAALDMTSDGDIAYMDMCLKNLMDNYEVDGFKFDGGDVDSYNVNCKTSNLTATEYTHAWFDYASKYDFNEVKDTWNACGKSFNQRLRDKSHSWNNGEGLDTIIPDGIALSLTGHPFICPDMVGGGEWTYFVPGGILDEELVVRSAQCSALFPMLQFSVAPWRILSKDNFKHVSDMEKLHCEMGEEIYELVQKSALTGELILSPLCYHYPNAGYETIIDEFMLGENILVSPVLQKDQMKRSVVFPDGMWEDEKGNSYTGNSTIICKSPVDTLLWFRKR